MISVQVQDSNGTNSRVFKAVKHSYDDLIANIDSIELFPSDQQHVVLTGEIAIASQTWLSWRL